MCGSCCFSTYFSSSSDWFVPQYGFILLIKQNPVIFTRLFGQNCRLFGRNLVENVWSRIRDGDCHVYGLYRTEGNIVVPCKLTDDSTINTTPITITLITSLYLISRILHKWNHNNWRIQRRKRSNPFLAPSLAENNFKLDDGSNRHWGKSRILFHEKFVFQWPGA